CHDKTRHAGYQKNCLIFNKIKQHVQILIHATKPFQYGVIITLKYSRKQKLKNNRSLKLF
ncbi:hypothetical protein, partial [Candidatus Trichorickettsia mobilis]|uniref:hypothetical protein n=1 Tax=Candidatus Trichorickettsia mobilis TaxID=1346319 RepID=UPI002B25CDF2